MLQFIISLMKSFVVVLISGAMIHRGAPRTTFSSLSLIYDVYLCNFVRYHVKCGNTLVSGTRSKKGLYTAVHIRPFVKSSY